MDAPITTFRNLVISLVGIAIVIYSFVLEHVLPLVRAYGPLQEYPTLALLITTVLTGSTLYAFLVAVPTGCYVWWGWKLRYPKLDFSGDWVAEITPTEQIGAHRTSSKSPALASFLVVVEIHQELFNVRVNGFNPKRSRFSSIIAEFDEKGELRFIYEQTRLQKDPQPELNTGTTQGVDALRVIGRTRFGRPCELHGQWHMCAIPKARLFQGSSKFIRINKKEREFLKAALEKNSNFTLPAFEQWRESSQPGTATSRTKV